MAGRPPKDNRRDRQYRVRLNESEDRILQYVSEMTEKQKSEVFRNALEDYYNKVRVQEALQADEGFDAWDTNHISLKRIIDCPYCGAANKCDFEEECNPTYDDKSMGEEITYNFDWESYECCDCGRVMRISGYICEYPVGAYNYEEINVEKMEDDE